MKRSLLPPGVAANGWAPLYKLPHGEERMRSNVAMDPELLDRAFELSGERTRTAAVTKALQEFIARRQQKG